MCGKLYRKAAEYGLADKDTRLTRFFDYKDGDLDMYLPIILSVLSEV